MSSLSFRRPKKHKHVDLNVTSLVDVLFLLLIFFTLTSTFKRAGELELQLPNSTSAGAGGREPAHKPVELVLTHHGTLLLDGAPVTFESVQARLRAIHGREPDREVTIEAETNVEHGQVVRLLDAVRTAGFTGVGIGVHTEASAPGRAKG